MAAVAMGSRAIVEVTEPDDEKEGVEATVLLLDSRVGDVPIANRQREGIFVGEEQVNASTHL